MGTFLTAMCFWQVLHANGLYKVGMDTMIGRWKRISTFKQETISSGAWDADVSAIETRNRKGTKVT